MAELKEEHPEVVERVRLIPPIVPGVEGVEELAHMEALSEGPAVLTISLSDELDSALAAPRVPGRFPSNNPISAAATPAATMRKVRRIRSNFGIDLDLDFAPCVEMRGLSASNFPDGV